MITNSERQKVQVFFESIVGYKYPDEIKPFETDLTEISLSTTQSSKLKEEINSDTVALFEKGLLSLFQGITDLNRGLTSWALVKLYYSTFYFLKAELNMAGFAIIRAKKIYTINPAPRSKLIKYNNKAKSDHGIVMELANKKLSSSDIMLSQKIEDVPCYSWMESRRNWVQYKRRNLSELSTTDFFFPKESMSYEDQINLFWNDSDPYYCFDPDYASLAIPLKRAQLTHKNLKLYGGAVTPKFEKLAKGVIVSAKIPRLLNFLLT